MPLPDDETIGIITYRRCNGTWVSRVVQWADSPFLPSGEGATCDAALEDLYRSARALRPALDTLSAPESISLRTSALLTLHGTRPSTRHDHIAYGEFVRRANSR